MSLWTIRKKELNQKITGLLWLNYFDLYPTGTVKSRSHSHPLSESRIKNGGTASNCKYIA